MQGDLNSTIKRLHRVMGSHKNHEQMIDDYKQHGYYANQLKYAVSFNISLHLRFTIFLMFLIINARSDTSIPKRNIKKEITCTDMSEMYIKDIKPVSNNSFITWHMLQLMVKMNRQGISTLRM